MTISGLRGGRAGMVLSIGSQAGTVESNSVDTSERIGEVDTSERIGEPT